MPYEVVDPDERAERGPIHRTLTAAMIAASPTQEVWELADDEPQTRTVMCWPDPEFQPKADPESARVEHFVREHIGRAEREATAILAEHNPVSPDKVHALVSLAWGKGFIVGFQRGSHTFAEIVNRMWDGERK